MPVSQEDVLAELERLDVTSLLSDLVSRPSYEREEAVGAYLQARLQSLGLNTVTTDIGPGRLNVLAHYGPSGRRLILNSHMDTVPAGNEADWDTGPFDPVVRGGRLYGRGACDAKGCLAAMAAALEALVRTGVSLRGQLTLMAVACEETGAQGTIAEAQKLSGQDVRVIIGEPTELGLHLAHKGVLRLDITTLGTAAHASMPQQGVNAISEMSPVLGALDALGTEVAQRRHPLVGHSSLVVTRIHGGVADNVVPDRCRIVIDRRLVPGEDLEEAQQEVQARLQTLQRADSALQVEIAVRIAVPSSQTDASDPFVTSLRASGREALGRPLDVGGFTACCDMWPFREKDIPTVIFGPGALDEAHTVGEWVELAQVRAAARFYAVAAMNWLGVG